ncbi:MAG: hypothetical protein H6727_03710 [Myxococcales bacterium]|nr:hypothetical protein [Myxococcales bacterium]
MRMQKYWNLLWFVGLFVATTGCSSPVKVVRETNPNPFNASTRLMAKKLIFREMKVDNGFEADFVTSQGPQFKEKWTSEKEFLAKIFRDSLRKSAPTVKIYVSKESPDMFIVRPQIKEMSPGGSGKPCKMLLEVRLLQGNATRDIIQVSAETKSDGNFADLQKRIRETVRKLGEYTAGYLKKRLGA